MWAVIGIYTGREDNVFWRRAKVTPNKIEAAGAKALSAMDAEPLGADIYGGDFFAAERSEWDSMRLEEHRSDGKRTWRVFEEANACYEVG